ncbi:MAG: hypothetical protein HMLKMBBP_00051 [Planctomycetes bacterium]|nr:hypothetical protein [Planctomycetota bacterium]
MITSRLLLSLDGIRHAMTDRAFGPVGPRGAPGVAEARSRLAAEVAGDGASLVVPEQVHSDAVRVVTAADRGRGHAPGIGAIAATDALVTKAPRLALLVQGADCPLVALADPDARIVGVVHSGWRGTAARIAANAVRTAVEQGASAPAIRAAVFPGLGPCCFEIGPEVVSAMTRPFGSRVARWLRRGQFDRSRFDLAGAIRYTLVDAGVRPEHVDVIPGCTMCGGNLWSHRGSGGSPERHGLAVALA